MANREDKTSLLYFLLLLREVNYFSASANVNTSVKQKMTINSKADTNCRDEIFQASGWYFIQ